MIEFECVCEKRDLLKKEEDLNRCWEEIDHSKSLKELMIILIK